MNDNQYIQKKPDWWPQWLALKEKLPVGRRFFYLELDMIVKAYREYNAGIYSFELVIHETMPAIIAEYVDGNGVIREHIFDRYPWERLP